MNTIAYYDAAPLLPQAIRPQNQGNPIIVEQQSRQSR